MKVGDLVKADDWVEQGKTGIVLKIQNVKHCRGVYVLINSKAKLIRIENLKVVNESR